MNSEERAILDQQVEKRLHWSQEELTQLAEAMPNDPATWPARMQKEREEYLKSSPVWEASVIENLPQFRDFILEEAVKEGVANSVVFCDECIEALFSVMGKDSIGKRLMLKLERVAPYGVLFDALHASVEMLPRLSRVLPFTKTNDILAAMGCERRVSEEPERVLEDA